MLDWTVEKGRHSGTPRRTSPSGRAISHRRQGAPTTDVELGLLPPWTEDVRDDYDAEIDLTFRCVDLRL
jgi:hypothetical protein